jgi:hypothetical protein
MGGIRRGEGDLVLDLCACTSPAARDLEGILEVF